MTATFVRRVELPVPAREAFAWHERPGAFERLLPPWQRVQVVLATGGIRDGARVSLRLPPGIAWDLEHRDWIEGRQFRDVQRSGPFARYAHTHAFADAPDGRSQMEDRLEFALPGGPFGALAQGFVAHEFDRLFRWRHRVTSLDLELARRRGGATRRIVVSGASGLVGTALVALLRTQGHRVQALVRRPANHADEITWDPAAGTIDTASLEGADAVVHLAGAGIADRPWSEARKREIEDSRVASTTLLARTLASMARRPSVFVSASAVGWWGDGGDAELDEAGPPGEGFLARTCAAWEAAAAPARDAGIRVVHPRIGLVLTPRGGALAKLLPVFAWGAGGPLGSGRQWWSWITLDDLVLSIEHAIATPSLVGPFAAVSPRPARMGEVAATLGRVLRRPAFAPAPAFALRGVLGAELAEAVLLSGQRVEPRKLVASGFAHRDADLEHALRVLLGRGA